MRYLTANIRKAETAGIRLTGKLRADDNTVILNESGVMSCPRLSGGTLEERARELGGEMYSEDAMLAYIRDRGIGISNVII